MLISVISTVSWTGSVVQTAGVQRSTRCIIGGAGRGETDQAVGKHSESCLFYKQWEQIRIGAALPNHMERMSSVLEGTQPAIVLSC